MTVIKEIVQIKNIEQVVADDFKPKLQVTLDIDIEEYQNLLEKHGSEEGFSILTRKILKQIEELK